MLVSWRLGVLLLAVLAQFPSGDGRTGSFCFSRNSTRVYSARLLQHGPNGSIVASQHIPRGERILAIPLSCTLWRHSPAADGLHDLAQSLASVLASVPLGECALGHHLWHSTSVQAKDERCAAGMRECVRKQDLDQQGDGMASTEGTGVEEVREIFAYVPAASVSRWTNPFT